jgi:hypothetical protein
MAQARNAKGDRQGAIKDLERAVELIQTARRPGTSFSSSVDSNGIQPRRRSEGHEGLRTFRFFRPSWLIVTMPPVGNLHDAVIGGGSPEVR